LPGAAPPKRSDSARHQKHEGAGRGKQ
jgi:hypothetical protein